MELQAIAYVSKAAKNLSVKDLNGVIQRADVFNKLAGVTGLLLFDGARFLQYFEGPEEGMETVYSRILDSSFHTEIVELARAPVGRRRTPYLSMRWTLVDRYEMSEAVSSDWRSFTKHVRRIPAIPTGIDRITALADQKLD